MHNNTRVVVYSGTVYKLKTHRPQHLEITVQSNYRNAYLTVYKKKSKWKNKFGSDSTWLIKNFLSRSNENTSNDNNTTYTTNEICLSSSANDFMKETTYITQSLNSLFHVAILHRQCKLNRLHQQHEQQRQQQNPAHFVWLKLRNSKNWFQFHSQRIDRQLRYSLSEHTNSTEQSTYSVESLPSTNPNNKSDSLLKSTSKSTLKSCLNESKDEFTDHQIEDVEKHMSIMRSNSNNNNGQNLLVGLFMESGKVNIFQFETVNERDSCLTSLERIIAVNKQTNAYPDIEFAWSVNVYFKPKDYTSACLIPNCNGLHYLCLTRTEILLIQKNLRIPKLIILYRFVRQCASRRDGQFRIYTGRASPTGECEIVFQLADHIEAAYAHEQCARLMRQTTTEISNAVGLSSLMSSSSSVSSSSSSWRTNFRSNRHCFRQSLPPLPRPVSLPINAVITSSNMKPLKQLYRSKSMQYNFSTTDHTSTDDNHEIVNCKSKQTSASTNLLHRSWPLLKSVENHYLTSNAYKMRDIEQIIVDHQQFQHALQPNYVMDYNNANANNNNSNHIDNEQNESKTNPLTNHSSVVICDNEKKNEDDPTSHYLEMNLDETEVKKDSSQSVTLRSQSLSHNRKKAFSTCSPPGIITSSNQFVEMSVKLLPNVIQPSSSMKEKITSNRENNDIFAHLFFEKISPLPTSPSPPLSSQFHLQQSSFSYRSSSYHTNKYDDNNNNNCTEKLSSSTSLQNSLQCSSVFSSSSCQSTSTRSRNSLFSNNFNNTNNYFTNPAPTYSTASSTCSIPPITVTTSNGLSHFNVSWTATRPRTSSDVSNMRRSFLNHSKSVVHHQQQQRQSCHIQSP
uniref:IRS-type PTB domain-containing protein n=1 Tax=Trichobilharzia regenti TaxID=157069 RepID=A0AA85IU85_TRIRE|nr:unnamed protein product [Trichobilharzia regenti]